MQAATRCGPLDVTDGYDRIGKLTHEAAGWAVSRDPFASNYTTTGDRLGPARTNTRVTPQPVQSLIVGPVVPLGGTCFTGGGRAVFLVG
jgi:hypothetical protein